MARLSTVDALPQVTPREIPFNYTSADDRQAIAFLLGAETVRLLDDLRSSRVTGRSARRLMRLFGDILVHRRNPYLFEELVRSSDRRKRFFTNADKDLRNINEGANGDQRVLETLARCRGLITNFRNDVEGAPDLRGRIRHALGAIVGNSNVLFDPFTLVSHATDATDWRLFLPLAVVTPDVESHVAPLLAAIGRLGLKAIPRGAGTGLTGGAVPLRPNCIVVNTEKLNHIRGTETREFILEDGRAQSSQLIEVEAGVITEKAMEYASERGQVFATDPTSAWASSIGGNIAENAGGKMAVRWGTCIDNLFEWQMAMPNGKRWTIRRTNHQLRKILPQDLVRFAVLSEEGESLKEIELRGTEIRKNGLWKDITNKALGGVPGLQKEGTDGVITSARFVLYPAYKVKQTLCLEFFGPDFDEASRVILELARAFPYPAENEETLLALEHFDDEYIRAIDYKVKAARAETPKAVLLIDVAADDPAQATRGVERIRTLLTEHPNTLMFVARDAAEGVRFWQDRKKLGAIARRTNAFKMNEDIVLPLDRLAEFSDYIDQLNVEEERYAQLLFAVRAKAILSAPQKNDDEDEAAQLAARVALCDEYRAAVEAIDNKGLRELVALKDFRHKLDRLLRGYPELRASVEEADKYVRDRRIVVATHMHAGDGNVHVNVPVLSNDRPMIERVDSLIDEVMAKVVSLDGVVSGEHGIGVTKFKYLEPEIIEKLSAYRREVDPTGLMNPGKLEDREVLKHIFTPSFNLLELEARILQHGQLGELSRKIAHCVRCGKCKPDCCVYHPGRGMFFHPRNKNLAIGSLIEALLYDAQRELSVSFELLPWLEEVADHCTICHKCLKPCPVDIDTGEVSILEREILASYGYKKTPLATKLTLNYLDSQSPVVNSVVRTTLVQIGGTVQRIASKIAKPLQTLEAAQNYYPLLMLKSSIDAVPSKTLRDVLPHCEEHQALVFEPAGNKASAKTVFYFPGCGSERLFSDISMATLHMLIEQGVRVILPPPFLCCGFPMHVNAKTDMHARTELRNSILFTQIREMFSNYDFDGCIVSCGTCREGLGTADTDKLFGRIVDIGAYMAETGLKLGGADEGYLYHAPCHDSLDGKATQLLTKIGGFGEIKSVPHCCSEAGTLSLSRPDITDKMLDRKRAAFEETLQGKKAVVLTNCPSCIQGLGRNRDIGVTPQHIAVVLAEKHSGPDWAKKFVEQAKSASVVSF